MCRMLQALLPRRPTVRTPARVRRHRRPQQAGGPGVAVRSDAWPCQDDRRAGHRLAVLTDSDHERLRRAVGVQHESVDEDPVAAGRRQERCEEPRRRRALARALHGRVRVARRHRRVLDRRSARLRHGQLDPDGDVDRLARDQIPQLAGELLAHVLERAGALIRRPDDPDEPCSLRRGVLQGRARRQTGRLDSDRIVEHTPGLAGQGTRPAVRSS